MATHQGIPVDKLAEVYVKIRDRKAQIKAEFDKEYDALNEQQDKIKRALLTYCKENHLEGFKTVAGTVSRRVKKRYWTSDWPSMYTFVLENEVPEFFEKRLNQSAVQQFMEEHPETIPPGLNIDAEYIISVTKPRKPRKSQE